MKENKVIRKKKTVDQNVAEALTKQKEIEVAKQFGISGTGLG